MIYSSFGRMSLDASPEKGTLLPVSKSGAWVWVPVAWDTRYSDPENQLDQAHRQFFLSGPCHFSAVGGVRLLRQQRGASAHVRLYSVDATTGARMPANFGESWEHFVGPEESNNSHINGTWQGWLGSGQKLAMEVDYWKAGSTTPARIIGGTMRVFTYRGTSC
jgi:hypothetical protein